MNQPSHGNLCQCPVVGPFSGSFLVDINSMIVKNITPPMMMCFQVNYLSCNNPSNTTHHHHLLSRILPGQACSLSAPHSPSLLVSLPILDLYIGYFPPRPLDRQWFWAVYLLFGSESSLIWQFCLWALPVLSILGGNVYTTHQREVWKLCSMGLKPCNSTDVLDI